MYFSKSVLCIILVLVKYNFALIGFDCGGRHLNITAVSLLGVKECNLEYKTPNSTRVPVQLLQLSDYGSTEVIQCKVEISRTIYHCGMHSHVSIVHNGRADYLHETGYTACLRMFQYGTFLLGPGEIIDGLKANRTTTRSVTMAGKVQIDGTCEGTQYSDPYGTWSGVVVQASIKISLKSHFAPVKLNSAKIVLKSGTVCNLADSFCLDPDDGYSYWQPMPTSSCNFNQYDVLYDGPATKITTENSETTSPVVYSLTTQDITFALTTTKKQSLCGYTLLRTEHPKLFILEIKGGDVFAKRGPISIHNLDIFTYMNSKFVYVEKHIRSQLAALYHNVIQQKCELERQVLTNALSFATTQPDEFAYRLLKEPGYMAITAGEAVHIIRCIPVETTVRKTQECFNELPVTVRNASLFLTPKSRILTKFGNERECSAEVPVLYRIEDTWIQFTPKPQALQIPPQQLQPMTKLSWGYISPGSLAISGIYSSEDIEKLRDHIMFPAEKPALLNEFARRLTGHEIHPGGIPMYNLLDEDSLNKIVESTSARIWQGFISFGSATAGVMGIFIVIRIIKIVIDTAIHGYALHTVYGCGVQLIGAIWSSLTHLLLHLARRPPAENPDNNKKGKPPTVLPPRSAITYQPATTTSSSGAPSITFKRAPTNSEMTSTTEPETTTTTTRDAPSTSPNPTVIEIPQPSPYDRARERLADVQIPPRPSGFVLK